MHRMRNNTTPYKMKGSPMQRNFGIGIANKTGISGLSTKGSPVRWAWLAAIPKAIAAAARTIATTVGQGVTAIGKGASSLAKGLGKGVEGIFTKGAKTSTRASGKLFGTSLGKFTKSSIIDTPFTPKSLKIGGFKRFGSSSLSLGKTNLGLFKGIKPQNLTGIQAFIQKHVGTKGGKLITKEGLSRFAKTKAGEAAASAGLSALTGGGRGEDYRAEGTRMPQLSFASSAGTRGEDPITKASGLTFRRKKY